MKDLEKYKIKRAAEELETHHVFLDALAHSREEAMGITEKKFEVPLGASTIYLLFGFFFVCSLILFSKTFYLQVIDGKQLYIASENNKGKINLIPAPRGIIYDSNGVKLVLNSPDFNLVCDKRNFIQSSPKSMSQISVMSAVLGQPEAQISAAINASEESKVLMLENIPQETLLVLEAKMNELSDCHIEKNTLRNYVMGPIFSHVLGYTGKPNKEELQSAANITSTDNVGKTGLEKFYDASLRGAPGRTKTDRNGGHQTDVVTPEKSGYNLVLNIDSKLQKEVYNALEKSIKNIGSKKGAAIAMDPRTGAILALVSYPAYDDNIFSGGISQADFNALLNDPNQPFFNRAIAAKYPTGSTIKPFEASGALQENIISPTKLINDPGYITIHSQYDPSVVYTFSGVTPHGLVDMRKAIAVSSNIYFYTVGGGYGDQKGLGPAGIKKYLDMYGWEQKTGIDLPGEFKGFVPSPGWKLQTKKENWWDGDTYNLSIGQSDLQVTPLHVATAYAAIANGGTLYQPQIVQKIIDGSGKDATVIQEFAPQVSSQLSIDQKNLQIVREGMRDGVQKEYGSSHMLADLPVAVAGKTGTAQTNKDGIFNTWSANFAPYDNPEIVFLATIEGVQGLRAATLPVAHDVLKYYFSQHK